MAENVKKKQTVKSKKREKKPRLKYHNNKTWFKFLMPQKEYGAYLEKVRVGEIDIPFLILILVLLVFGLIMMYSASYAWAISDGLSQDYYFKRQLMMAAIGLAIMIYVASPLFDYHIIKNPVITFGLFILCVILMGIVHIPGIGKSEADASRWINVGTLFSFQPSEVMKLGLIVLFAHMLSSNYNKKDTFKFGIAPYILLIMVAAGLTIAQRHLSGTVIICIIGLAMMFIGGVNLKHFIPTCIAGVAALAMLVLGLYAAGKFDYIMDRIHGWLYTFDDKYRDIAWQTRNSLIAIGSGGVFGLGLGNSRQKFLYLPESKNDFVFSIVCEELGFVGASVVIILFLMLIFRGFAIAENAPDKYGMLLAAGLVIQIGVQALLNIAVVTNTIPNTGISLPFFSYGGSALIMQLAQMGIVLNISRQSIPRKGKADADMPPDKESREIQEAKDTLGAGNVIKITRKNKNTK